MSTDLRLGRYQDVLGDVECDLLCVDAPYSARTHAGHDGGTAFEFEVMWADDADAVVEPHSSRAATGNTRDLT